MEILKNFMVGLGVVVVACFIWLMSILILPIVFIAGPLLFIILKTLLFFVFCFFFIVFIGWLMRKGLNGKLNSGNDDENNDIKAA